MDLQIAVAVVWLVQSGQFASLLHAAEIS